MSLSVQGSRGAFDRRAKEATNEHRIGGCEVAPKRSGGVYWAVPSHDHTRTNDDASFFTSEAARSARIHTVLALLLPYSEHMMFSYVHTFLDLLSAD